jgi:hypothetical protein
MKSPGAKGNFGLDPECFHELESAARKSAKNEQGCKGVQRTEIRPDGGPPCATQEGDGCFHDAGHGSAHRHGRAGERTGRKVLAEMDLSISDAIRLLLVRVAAEKMLPFEVR